MSIDDAENSSYGADPVLLFLFVMGTRRWGYNGQDVETYTYNGTDFKPDAAVALGTFQQSLAELSTDISIDISSTSEVAQMFVPYMPPEPVYVRVFRHHPEYAPGEYDVEVAAEVVSSRFDEETGVCTLTSRLISKDLDRKIPWCVYSPQCNYAVYGVGCQVDREAFVTVTNVTSGAGLTTISSPDFATAGVGNDEPDEWFRGGFLIHVNSGEMRFIVRHDTNSPDVTIQVPFRNMVNGDQVRAYPGCNRLRNHCAGRFNNLHRMLGFPWQPSKNPYTQSVYGNESSNTKNVAKTTSKLRGSTTTTS